MWYATQTTQSDSCSTIVEKKKQSTFTAIRPLDSCLRFLLLQTFESITHTLIFRDMTFSKKKNLQYEAL